MIVVSFKAVSWHSSKVTGINHENLVHSLTKIHANLGRGIRCPGQDLNWELREHKMYCLNHLVWLGIQNEVDFWTTQATVQFPKYNSVVWSY